MGKSGRMTLKARAAQKTIFQTSLSLLLSNAINPSLKFHMKNSGWVQWWSTNTSDIVCLHAFFIRGHCFSLLTEQKRQQKTVNLTQPRSLKATVSNSALTVEGCQEIFKSRQL